VLSDREVWSSNDTAPGMTASSNPYRGFRFLAEVIKHAVWLYQCFSLSLRDVELILAARGIVVSYESIRECALRVDRLFANTLKQRRPKPVPLARGSAAVRPSGPDKAWAIVRSEVRVSLQRTGLESALDASMARLSGQKQI